MSCCISLMKQTGFLINKDEAIFSLGKEVENLKNTLGNYELTESTLKREILSLSQNKNLVEKQQQEIKIQNSELNTTNRNISERLVILQRENELLQNSIELTKKHETRFLVSILPQMHILGRSKSIQISNRFSRGKEQIFTT